MVLAMKKGQLAFSERQQQLISLGNNISQFLQHFLKFKRSARVSEQINYSQCLKISL